MTSLRITGMDHIVLNVADVERSLSFYTGILGLEGLRVEEFRKGEVGFPSVRISGDTLIDLSPSKGAAPAEDASKNLNHYCLVAENVEFPALIEALKGEGVTVLQGPASRWGAKGRGPSIYILDPDGNQIEIKSY